MMLHSFALSLVYVLSLTTVYGFTTSRRSHCRRCPLPKPAKAALHQLRLSDSKGVSSAATKRLSSTTNIGGIRRNRLRSKVQTFWSQRMFSNCIYFSTGFENVRAMALYGKLVSMCTGNTVRTVTALSDGRWRDALSPGGLVVSYILGAAISRWIRVRVQQKAQREDQSGIDSSSTPVEINDSGALEQVPQIEMDAVRRSMLGRFSRGIVPSILILYGLAEVFMHSSVPVVSTWMQACAYGLLYTTAQELVGGGMIFFAITGHCTVLAKSALDGVLDKNNSAARKRVLERAEYLFSFVVGAWFAVKCWESLVASMPGYLARVFQGHAWKGIWYAMAFLGVQYTV